MYKRTVSFRDTTPVSYTHLAQSLNDDSLSNCLKRLSNWTRQAVNHKVEIYLDFALHSFGFCEKINDKPNINGGIIFSPHASQNRWSIHT